jgi:hypothetical protein
VPPDPRAQTPVKQALGSGVDRILGQNAFTALNTKFFGSRNSGGKELLRAIALIPDSALRIDSCKSECLDRLVLLGEGHLRAAVREFVQHYHEERPHQGLGNALIAPKTTVIGTGQVKRRERLGGLLKFYYRQAA